MGERDRVLVVHASKRGATKDIAEFVATRLRAGERRWTCGM